MDAPALEGLLRQSTWFRTPLGQAGLLSRRSVASAASWSFCRHWSGAARRSGFDAAREAIRLNHRQRRGAGVRGDVPCAGGDLFAAVFQLPNGRQRTVRFGTGSNYVSNPRKTARDRAAYIARHRVNENHGDPLTPGALSRWLLWGESRSLARNTAAPARAPGGAGFKGQRPLRTVSPALPMMPLPLSPPPRLFRPAGWC